MERDGTRRGPGAATSGALCSPKRQVKAEMKIHIDEERCRGHARCLVIAPDAFDFIDEEDRAFVVDDGVAVTPDDVLLEAQEECPEHAISVSANQSSDTAENEKSR